MKAWYFIRWQECQGMWVHSLEGKHWASKGLVTASGFVVLLLPFQWPIDLWDFHPDSSPSPSSAITTHHHSLNNFQHRSCYCIKLIFPFPQATATAILSAIHSSTATLMASPWWWRARIVLWPRHKCFSANHLRMVWVGHLPSSPVGWERYQWSSWVHSCLLHQHHPDGHCHAMDHSVHHQAGAHPWVLGRRGTCTPLPPLAIWLPPPLLLSCI